MIHEGFGGIRRKFTLQGTINISHQTGKGQSSSNIPLVKMICKFPGGYFFFFFAWLTLDQLVSILEISL